MSSETSNLSHSLNRLQTHYPCVGLERVFRQTEVYAFGVGRDLGPGEGPVNPDTETLFIAGKDVRE